MIRSSDLSIGASDQVVATECVHAVAKGPWLEDEHDTRLGVSVECLDELLDRPLDMEDASTVDVVMRCLNEVVNGIYFDAEDWRAWFTVSREEVEALENRLRKER